MGLGLRLLQRRRRARHLEIYVMGSDGSNLTRLTEEGWNDSPVWSPDGSKIAFVSNRGTGGSGYGLTFT